MIDWLDKTKGEYNMNNILRHLKNFYFTERKPLYVVVKELIQYTFYEKELPIYYFLNLLYRPDINNIRDFAGGRKLNKINKQYHSKNVFLDNKLLFYKIMYALNYRTPKVLAYSCNGNLHIMMGIKE